MAYIYGSPGHDHVTTNFAGRRDIFLRLALPLLFLFALASAGLHAFLQGSYILTAFSAIFFVFLLLHFEELGLTMALRLTGADTKARADRIVGKTLRLLPDGYHVFHDLELDGVRIDHAVVGPNGFFPVMTRTNLGTITDVRDSLRLNGWPFLRDVVSLSWSRSQAMLRHLALGHSGDLQVCPVLCFSRASVEAGHLMRGVMIAQTSTLVRLILEHESTLSSEKVLKLTDKLSLMVREKTVEPEVTHLETRPAPGQAQAAAETRRPACTKCRHVPSDLEAELFPGECPRCGRLQSAGADAAVTPALQKLPGAQHTPVAALATACLIVAAGSALLAYQAGLFDSDSTAQASIAPAAAELDAGPRAASPVQAQEPRPSTAKDSRTQPLPLPTEPTRAGAADGEKPRQAAQPPVTAPTPPRTAAADRTTPAPAAPAEPTTDARTAAAKPQGPARDSSMGTLTVVTARPVTLWLTNDQTAKRFGPYETSPRKALDIVLPKGFYSVVLVDNGRRRQTTVSFLGDAGRLEF